MRTSGVNIQPYKFDPKVTSNNTFDNSVRKNTSNNTFDNSVRIEICSCIAAGLVNTHLPNCKPITAMVSSFMESANQTRKMGLIEAVIKIQRAFRRYLSKPDQTLSLTLTTEDMISRGDTGFLKHLELNNTEEYDAPLSVRDLLHGLENTLNSKN